MSLRLVYSNKNTEVTSCRKREIIKEALVSNALPTRDRYEYVLSLIFQHSLAATKLSVATPDERFMQEVHQRCREQSAKLDITGHWTIFQTLKPSTGALIVTDGVFYDVRLKIVSLGDRIYHRYIAAAFA